MSLIMRGSGLAEMTHDIGLTTSLWVLAVRQGVSEGVAWDVSLNESSYGWTRQVSKCIRYYLFVRCNHCNSKAAQIECVRSVQRYWYIRHFFIYVIFCGVCFHIPSYGYGYGDFPDELQLIGRFVWEFLGGSNDSRSIVDALFR
jgi:hypothetical protein